jgi:phosphoribosylamine-glycine ligase
LRYKDISEKFEGWKIESFQKEQVVLSRDFEGKCAEHYIVKLVDGKVVIFYEIAQDGKEIKDITGNHP